MSFVRCLFLLILHTQTLFGQEVTLTQQPMPASVGQPVTLTCSAPCHANGSFVRVQFDPPRSDPTTSSPSRSPPGGLGVTAQVSFTATRDDVGLAVSCQAFDPTGSTTNESSVTLAVQAPPTLSQLCVRASQDVSCRVCKHCAYNVSTGDSLHLECTAVGSTPASRVAWDVRGQDGGATGGGTSPGVLRPRHLSSAPSGDSRFTDVLGTARVEIPEGAGGGDFSVACLVLYPDNATLFAEEQLRVLVQQGAGKAFDKKTWIVAVVLANSLVVLLVSVLCCIGWRRKTRKRRKKKNKKRETSSEESEGDDSYPMISLAFGHELGDTLKSGVTTDRARKTFIPGLEFPRTRVRLQEMIGDGNFGQVYKAVAKGIVRGGVDTTVAVKTIKGEGDSVWRDFKNELSIFKNLKQHPYVVSILGCCTNAEPYYMIMEYIPNGTLQDYITQKRLAWGKARLTSHASKEALSAVHVLMFAFQVANGMEYLSSMHLIHRDLATRNVLLGEGLVCKLSDFGLARDVTESEQYKMLSRSAVPVRWLALECLMSNTYTTKSDVWSFGILLWELVTLGALPYPERSPDAIIDAVRRGFRLPRPAHCGSALYGMMAACWNAAPKARPSFTELQTKLDHFLKFDSEALDMPNFLANRYAYPETSKTVYTQFVESQ